MAQAQPGSLPATWQQALDIEKRLRPELAKKGFWHPDVRRLRAALQQAYISTLISHFEFSQVGIL